MITHTVSDDQKAAADALHKANAEWRAELQRKDALHARIVSGERICPECGRPDEETLACAVVGCPKVKS